MNKATVYITQDNNKNYAPAHNYGVPTFITNLEYESICNSANNRNIHSDIRKFVSTFNPEVDYVLLSGDPVVIGLVINAAFSISGSVQVLKWSSQDRMYVPMTLEETQEGVVDR